MESYRDVTIITLSNSTGMLLCYGGDACSIDGEVERSYSVRVAGAGRGIVSCFTIFWGFQGCFGPAWSPIGMKDCLPGVATYPCSMGARQPLVMGRGTEGGFHSAWEVTCSQ